MNSEKMSDIFNSEKMKASDTAQTTLEQRLDEGGLEYVLNRSLDGTFIIKIDTDKTREAEDILKEFEYENQIGECSWFSDLELNRDGDAVTIYYTKPENIPVTDDVTKAIEQLQAAIDKFSDFFPESKIELAEIKTDNQIKRFLVTKIDGTSPSGKVHAQLLYEAQKNLLSLDPDTNWVESLTLKQDAMGGFLIELDPTKFQKPRATETDE